MQPLLRTLRFPLRHARAQKLQIREARQFSQPSNSHVHSRVTSRLTPTVLVIGFIPIFTFALGTWQVQRLRWKLDLIDQLNDQIHREPLELPDFVNLDLLPEFAFRKVILKGTWDHARSILLGPKTRDGVHGYHIISPLVREGGSTILVDRGFVSNETVSSTHGVQVPHKSQGDVEVLGMLRTQQPRNRFTPDNKPEKGEWYWVDVEGIKEWLGGDENRVQGVFVEALFDGNTGEVANLIARGVPVGRSGEIELRNMHATYALTWYSLSAVTAVMFVVLLRRPRPASTRLPLS